MLSKIIGKIRGFIRGNVKSISIFHNTEDAEKANNFRIVLRRTYTSTVPTRMVPVKRYTLNKKNYTLERDTFLVTYVFSGGFFGKSVVATDLVQWAPKP